MSGLAAVLAGRREAGVLRWTSAERADDVAHAVGTAGWAFAHVDGWTHQTKAEVLAALAEALALPDWFGHNLDALADCLRSVPDRTVILWDGWGTLARTDAAAYDGVVAVLAERAGPRGPLVLLRGQGPESDLPLLD